jgi:nucleoside-diphosphate-sugar epimerase
VTKDVEGTVLNLGTGEDIRIGDVANRIAQKVDRPVKIVIDPQRLRPEKSEVLHLISDNQRARDVIGWVPRVSLDAGLDLTIDWIRHNLDRYQSGRYEF